MVQYQEMGLLTAKALLGVRRRRGDGFEGWGGKGKGTGVSHLIWEKKKITGEGEKNAYNLYLFF